MKQYLLLLTLLMVQLLILHCFTLLTLLSKIFITLSIAIRILEPMS